MAVDFVFTTDLGECFFMHHAQTSPAISTQALSLTARAIPVQSGFIRETGLLSCRSRPACAGLPYQQLKQQQDNCDDYQKGTDGCDNRLHIH